MSRRRGVGVGDVAGLRLDHGVGFGQVLSQLPEIVVRQHHMVPTILLGHRAILRSRASMSRLRGEVQESDLAARAGVSDVEDNVVWQMAYLVAWKATCEAA